MPANKSMLLPIGISAEKSKKYQNLMQNMKPEKNISFKSKNEKQQTTVLDVINAYKCKVLNGVEQKNSEATRKKNALAELSKVFKRFQESNKTYNKIY